MDVREKLVELLKSQFYDEYEFEEVADYLIAHGVTVQDNTEINDEFLERLRKAPVTVMTEEPTIEVVQEWFSVKDRLPEKDGQYLIFTTQYFTPDHVGEIDHRDGIEISGYYNGYGFLSTNGIYAKYWCCLPQPPKGE